MSLIFQSMLNNVFTVSRRVRTSDGQGGWALAWEAVEPVTGRIRPATSSERETAAREERQITHVLYVVDGEDVARGDVVTWQSGPAGLALALEVEVQGVREPSLAGEHWEIDCVERQVEVSGEVGS